MELKYIFKLCIKWLWLIILLPFFAGTGAWYVSTYATEPVYEASSTMYILNTLREERITAVYGDITSAQNAIRNYSEIVKSKSVVNEALTDLQLTDYTAERFSGDISVVFSDRNSFIVRINVRDTDPKLACDMANKLSEIFVSKTDDIMKMSVIDILDRAEIPSYPSNNSTRKNTSLAVMAGLIFCSVIIFAVEYAGTVVIKNEADIHKFLGLNVLGTIPELKNIKTFN